MKSSTELKQERADLFDEMNAIMETAKAENRDFNEEENTRYDELRSEIEALDSKIERAEQIEADKRRIEEMKMQRNRQRDTRTKDEDKVKKRYSLVRAMYHAARNKPLDGVEKEMQEEAEREAEKANQVIRGIGVPSMLFAPAQRADLTAGVAATAADTIATDLGELIPFLRPRLQVQNLGATMLMDLQGDLELPRKTGETTANWTGETTAATETNPTFEKFKLSPKRLAAFTEYSLQLLRQSSIGVENMVREDLAFATQKAVDLAAINGSGSSNQPTGILNISGISSVAIGTNGGAPTRDHLVDLVAAIDTSNALMGNLSFLTTPGVKGKLMKTKTDAGSGIFVWSEGTSNLIGYNAATSTQVPSNLTKGTGTNLHAILFANWSELIVASWLGLDVIVNPYSRDTEGLIRTTVNSFWDINVRHKESFAAIVDADIS